MISHIGYFSKTFLAKILEKIIQLYSHSTVFLEMTYRDQKQLEQNNVDHLFQKIPS